MRGTALGSRSVGYSSGAKQRDLLGRPGLGIRLPSSQVEVKGLPWVCWPPGHLDEFGTLESGISKRVGVEDRSGGSGTDQGSNSSQSYHPVPLAGQFGVREVFSKHPRSSRSIACRGKRAGAPHQGSALATS